MLGGHHSEALPRGPALTALLRVSSGVGAIARAGGAGGVPLRPRGQRLVHSDRVCLHLALQAVHLLPAETGEACGQTRAGGAVPRKRQPAASDPALTAGRSHTPSGARRASLLGQHERDSGHFPVQHTEADTLTGENVGKTEPRVCPAGRPLTGPEPHLPSPQTRASHCPARRVI